MLVVANGAFKSGSTWLYKLLKLLTQFEPPPSDYCNPAWLLPSLHPGLLKQFLHDVDYMNHNYLCKNHFSEQSQQAALLAHPNVQIFSIERDLRDVVVSAYYHSQRIDGFKGTFETYYWHKGRTVAHEVRLYNTMWQITSPQIHLTQYERLLDQFDAELSKIAHALGNDLTIREHNEIKAASDFKKMKAKSSGGHFRKGTAGDWENHFDAAIADDMKEIQAGRLASISPQRKGLMKWKSIIQSLKS